MKTLPATGACNRRPQKCGWCADVFGRDDFCHDKEGRCHPIRGAVPASVRPDRVWECACAKAHHPKPVRS